MREISKIISRLSRSQWDICLDKIQSSWLDFRLVIVCDAFPNVLIILELLLLLSILGGDLLQLTFEIGRRIRVAHWLLELPINLVVDVLIARILNWRCTLLLVLYCHYWVNILIHFRDYFHINDLGVVVSLLGFGRIKVFRVDGRGDASYCSWWSSTGWGILLLDLLILQCQRPTSAGAVGL